MSLRVESREQWGLSRSLSVCVCPFETGIGVEVEDRTGNDDDV